MKIILVFILVSALALAACSEPVSVPESPAEPETIEDIETPVEPDELEIIQDADEPDQPDETAEEPDEPVIAEPPDEPPPVAPTEPQAAEISAQQAEATALERFNLLWFDSAPGFSGEIKSTELTAQRGERIYRVEVGQDNTDALLRVDINVQTGEIIREYQFVWHDVEPNFTKDIVYIFSGGTEHAPHQHWHHGSFETHPNPDDPDEPLTGYSASGFPLSPWDVDKFLTAIPLQADFEIRFAQSHSGNALYTLYNDIYEEVYSFADKFTPPTQAGEYILAIFTSLHTEDEDGVYWNAYQFLVKLAVS
jgi:uncharacterized membrane protein YkoI